MMMKKKKIKHTILYLSGSSYRGEDYVKEHADRLATHTGVLLSYHDLNKMGITWNRLVDLKEKT